MKDKSWKTNTIKHVIRTIWDKPQSELRGNSAYKFKIFSAYS